MSKGNKIVPLTQDIPQISLEKTRINAKTNIKYKLLEKFRIDSIMCYLHCLETDPYHPYKIQFQIEEIGKPILKCNDFPHDL